MKSRVSEAYLKSRVLLSLQIGNELCLVNLMFQ